MDSLSSHKIDSIEGEIDQYRDLLIARDALKKEEGRIWQEYVWQFGSLLEELFRARIECVALKKKIAFCQRKLNRREEIVLCDMETAVQTELSSYYEELELLLAQKNSSRGRLLSSFEVLQIKKLYRKIVFLIHPDLHPDLFEKEEIRELWGKAEEAYACNDLKKLEEAEFLIREEIRREGVPSEPPKTEGLGEKIEQLREEILQITSGDPYQYKFLLEDKSLAEEERSRLEEEIAQFNAHIGELKIRLSGFTVTEMLQ